jgi:S1-C subfamily serine protease
VAVLQLPNVADTVERVRPAVVSILAEVVVMTRLGPRSSFGSGTGVIISPEGLVLTNNHVVQDAGKIIVTLDDGTQAEAKVVGADRLSDLAVLRIPNGSYAHLPLTRPVKLRVGEWVIAIGNALALPGGPTVTVGVVSALGRSIETSPGVTLYDLVQTDTVINPGNSGGPLLNLRGDLVGINTVVQRATPSGTPVEGIGFAINTETASQVAEQLITIGRVRWAWMGVIMADLVPEVAAGVGLPVREGVVIQNLLIGSPADQAGIKPGDIMLSADGHKLATVSDITRLLKQEFRAGQEIEVELFRDGARRKIRLLLGERPQQ